MAHQLVAKRAKATSIFGPPNKCCANKSCASVNELRKCFDGRGLPSEPQLTAWTSPQTVTNEPRSHTRN